MGSTIEMQATVVMHVVIQLAGKQTVQKQNTAKYCAKFKKRKILKLYQSALRSTCISEGRMKVSSRSV